MKLKLPLKGVSDVLASSEQPELTTRDMLNMRGVDPVTKQIRLAQRAGMSKFNTSQVNGTAPIRAVRTVTFSRKGVTYTEKTSTSAAPLGLSSSPYNIRTDTASTVSMNDCDRHGNLYSTDGNAGIEKRNSTLEVQWRLSLPVTQNTQVVRALRVGSIPGASGFNECVFCGVSAGGRQLDAKLWGYRQVEIDNVDEPDTVRAEQIFEITPGAYTERIRIHNGRLYAAQNEPDKGQAWVRVYFGLNTPNPEVELEFEVPYPIYDIDVRASDGAIVTCHPQNEERGIDPRATSYSARDLAREWRLEDHLL